MKLENAFLLSEMIHNDDNKLEQDLNDIKNFCTRLYTFVSHMNNDNNRVFDNGVVGLLGLYNDFVKELDTALKNAKKSRKEKIL